MNRLSPVEAIRGQGVVPILRSATAEDAVATAEVCAAAGMEVIELTCSTPEVGSAIAELSSRGHLIGLGTVVDAEQVEMAAEAGASFIVSFASPRTVIEAAREHGLQIIPGALTPSEVLACVQEGNDVVKLFPAHAVGPPYLRDLRSVMPGLRAIATGGIAPDDGSIASWLEAGAMAVGLGSSLGTVANVGAETVGDRADRALAEAQAARASADR